MGMRGVFRFVPFRWIGITFITALVGVSKKKIYRIPLLVSPARYTRQHSSRHRGTADGCHGY